MALPTRYAAANMIPLLCLALLAICGSANSAPSSASTTASGPAATHTVTVGVGDFSFNPTSLTANVGDDVLFIFYPQNHSVARAEYGYPCIPYENTGPNKVGFWSGFQPVAKASEDAPTFSITINDTEPVFFYCSAPEACIPRAMIGVINPNSTQSFANQKAFVANSTIQLSPGEQNPTEAGASASPSSSAGSSSSSSSGLGAGAIAGIVVGVIALIALAGIIFYLCGRNRTLASVLRYSQPPRPRNIPPVPFTPSLSSSPYSPEFSPKPVMPVSPRSGLGPHESWQTQSTANQYRPTSPEMAATGGMMSPQHFSQGYGQGGYNVVENPANNAPAYRGHPSPADAPWSPSGFVQMQQYSQVPQNPDMAPVIDQHSPGLSQGSASYGEQSTTRPVEEGPHELDARSSAPETPGGAPPQYAARTFSFSAGSDGPPGVEKVLRD